MPDQDPSADSIILAKRQAENDQAIAQAYLAANPDRAKAYGLETASAQPQGAMPSPEGTDAGPGEQNGPPESQATRYAHPLIGSPVAITPKVQAEAQGGSVTGLDRDALGKEVGPTTA